MIQFDEHIFQIGWFNHQLDTLYETKDQVLQFFIIGGALVLDPRLEHIHLSSL